MCEKCFGMHEASNPLVCSTQCGHPTPIVGIFRWCEACALEKNVCMRCGGPRKPKK